MLLLLLDIHRNILSVQCFIRCISNGTSKIQIILKTNSLCVKSWGDLSQFRHLKVLMPDNFLQPCTVSSICCKNSKEHSLSLEDNVVQMNFPLSLSTSGPSSDENFQTEIAFRFQIYNNSVIENCILKSGVTLHFKDFMQKKFEKYETCCILCTSCGSLLTEKDINFKFVHKYYEEMTDSAETWFCHEHGDHKSAENNSDSIYISDMHFYIHDSVLKLPLLLESNKCYKCAKCLSILSFKKKMNKPHYIGFFSDKIMLEKEETTTYKIQTYKREIALFAFCSIIQDLVNLVDICDIYLQSKVDEKMEVLLLRFNSQKVFQFLLHEENDDEIPYEIEFNTKEVYKVLYCVCSPDSKLSKKWRHDFKVDFFLISDNMMAVIKKMLQESSKYAPNNQETVDGFSLGYLPACISAIDI